MHMSKTFFNKSPPHCPAMHIHAKLKKHIGYQNLFILCSANMYRVFSGKFKDRETAQKTQLTLSFETQSLRQNV